MATVCTIASIMVIGVTISVTTSILSSFLFFLDDFEDKLDCDTMRGFPRLSDEFPLGLGELVDSHQKFDVV